MNEMILQIALAIAGGLLVGAVVSWTVRSRQASQELEIAQGNWQHKLEQAVNKARASEGQAANLQASLADTQRLVLKSKHAAATAGTEIESLKERHQSTAMTLSATRAERDEFASRVDQQQRFVHAAKLRINELNDEFSKSREFYKSQLGSAIEQRHALERKIESMSCEQKSLTELLTASKNEQESLNSMLANARTRLENLDAIENKAISLEADNSDMRHKLETANRDIEKLQRAVQDADAMEAENADMRRKLESSNREIEKLQRTAQDTEAMEAENADMRHKLETTNHEVERLKRNAQELEELRQQNRELARCLDSMEKSRRQYEKDAQRYRDQFESSEKESETLRMKLGDIEQSLTEMQDEEEKAREVPRSAPNLVEAPSPGEGDDLTKIVGIGKVFESMLHDLGIYYFRQIATFGPSELARVNAELKEFKGRIENDDWIGQARELHHKKYGDSNRMADAG